MIHHVQLACPPGSEDASRAFYAGVLDLAEIPKPAVLAARGGCWFRGAGIELHLGVEDDFRPARKAHPALLVDDLDAWAQRLTGAGYPAAHDDEFPGMRRFYSHDPHGNRLEFLQPSTPAEEAVVAIDFSDPALSSTCAGTAARDRFPSGRLVERDRWTLWLASSNGAGAPTWSAGTGEQP